LLVVAGNAIRRVPIDVNIAWAAADRSLAQTENGRILEVLKQTNWRIEGPNGAAAILKLNPSTLRGRIKKLGVARSREGVPKFRDIWRKRRRALANQNEQPAFSLTF
jgi:Bacterial regulatory protein, Fis family